MPTETKHTPTPWRVVSASYYMRDDAESTHGIEGGKGMILAEMVGDQIPNQEANAALIAHRVNTYEEIERQRDALLELVGYLLEADPEGEIQVTDRAIANKLPAMYEQTARAAIAACEQTP